jgi:hypothetical protein
MALLGLGAFVAWHGITGRREADYEHWHGLAVRISRSGMDRDAELLDRLAARAERMARQERYRAEAMASRRRES